MYTNLNHFHLTARNYEAMPPSIEVFAYMLTVLLVIMLHITFGFLLL